MIAGKIFEEGEEEKLWEYVRERLPKYTAVSLNMSKKGERNHIAIPFEEECMLPKYVTILKNNVEPHFTIRALARTVILLTKIKVAFERLADEYKYTGLDWLNEVYKQSITEKATLIEKTYDMLAGHPVSEWVENVKGLGRLDAIMFLGFINPHIATTAGKASAYWGLAGQKSSLRNKSEKEKPVGNRILRGYAYFVAQRIVMKKDSYYYPLHQAKKEYLAEREAINGTGKPKIAIDRMAKLWLAHLIVSHAWEIYRQSEKLPIHPHTPHIPPKPSPEAEPRKEIIQLLKTPRKNLIESR